MNLKIEKDSDVTLSSTLLWSSPAPYFRPRIAKPRTGLRLASIVSDRLYQGLKFECELLLLTPDNWKSALGLGRPDFLLVESCWDTATGHWYLAQTHPGEQQEIMLAIIDYCKKNAIPTVYWHTQDLLYRYVFNTFADNFDFVFCADPRNIDYLQRKDIEADVLLPAIQPAIHNPFREFSDADKFNLDILYDGWADILRFGRDLAFLKSFKNLGLSIIESRFRLFRNKLNDTNGLKGNVLGCVHWQDRIMALKYAKLCIMADSTIATSTLQQWMALENAAFRVPVLHRGEFEPKDTRKNIIHDFADDKELVDHAEYILNNKLAGQKQGHLAWRTIYQNHTFSHRLGSICDALNVRHDIDEYPLVSVVIATFREALLPRCVENFRKQTYPNKELVLVVNSNSYSQDKANDLMSEGSDIRCHIVPSERVEGGCLNFGVMAAKGHFVIKMDDDDHYSENFIADMILHGKAVDADLFGKANRFIHFMDDDSTYSRVGRPELTVIPPGKLLNAHISGNSLSGKTEFFQNSRYSDLNFASTDTCYHGNNLRSKGVFALYDDFGLIMERSMEVSGHSWRITSKSLKKTMEFLCDGISADVLS